MDIEVSQVMGEAEEEEEEVAKERCPEEELEVALENYRQSEIAKLHLDMHSLIQEQKDSIIEVNLQPMNVARIEEYLQRLGRLEKRKKAVEKKSQAIKYRFRAVIEALKKKGH